MKNKRAEYIKCAFINHANNNVKQKYKTWCGKSGNDAFFMDVIHALLNFKRGGRLLLCPECAEAIKRAIDLASG